MTILLLALVPTGRYLVRAAWEEGKILSARRSIADLVTFGGAPAEARAKLELVLAARAFAVESLGLKANQSFTTYSALTRDTLVLLVSGTRRDMLEPKTWWFPIIGRVPYKGFFDFHDATAESQRLDGGGYDTYVRPASAFSTLGFFNDPLLSTTLREDSASLSNTVIHELTHNTFYAPGQTVFNESLASFIGARGAEALFRSRGDSALAAESEATWQDDKVLAAFWGALYSRIDSAFRANPTRDAAGHAARMKARERLYGEARQELINSVGPKMRRVNPRAVVRMRLDNASLMAHRVYATDLDLFDQLYQREGNDLPKTLRRVIELAKSRPGDPYGAVREWLVSAPAESPP
ncbi:MAG: aminopeptidase [Gemmatimonadota bacterium]|nr:aminopeptidase [Gemmatimonadota bacterium]